MQQMRKTGKKALS
jgi:PIN domain nuclease of toxin-antitoxin system